LPSPSYYIIKIELSRIRKYDILHNKDFIKMYISGLAKQGFTGLVNLAYPPLCAICNEKILHIRQDLSICEGCFNKIKKNPPPYCKRCGRSLSELAGDVRTCWECGEKSFHYKQSWSCFLYEGVVKDAIHLLKYSKKVSLVNLFCFLLTDFLKENPEILKDIDGILAVPLHTVKLREREFNQAYILTEAIVKEFNISDFSGCLKRTAATLPQSGLDRNKRFDNVKGTFAVAGSGPVCGKNLLIVDDLFTTGATLNECARVLNKVGTKTIRCLTFARGS